MFRRRAVVNTGAAAVFVAGVVVAASTGMRAGGPDDVSDSPLGAMGGFNINGADDTLGGLGRENDAGFGTPGGFGNYDVSNAGLGLPGGLGVIGANDAQPSLSIQVVSGSLHDFLIGDEVVPLGQDNVWLTGTALVIAHGNEAMAIPFDGREPSIVSVPSGSIGTLLELAASLNQQVIQGDLDPDQLCAGLNPCSVPGWTHSQSCYCRAWCACGRDPTKICEFDAQEPAPSNDGQATSGYRCRWKCCESTSPSQ